MPTALRWTLRLAIVLGMLGGLHYYAGRRLIVDAGLEGGAAWTGWLVLAGLFSLLLYQAFGQRLRWPGARRLVWPATLWLGSGFLLVTILAASDLLLWVLGSPVRAAALAPDAPSDLGPVRALAVSAGVVGLSAFGVWSALGPPAVRRIEVKVRGDVRLDGFRIVQISDLHIGPILKRGFLRDVVERVNALEPDLVAVTGDLVDGSVEQFGDEITPLAELRARHGAFFVTGNHDHYSGASSWVERIEKQGLSVLRNRCVRIRHGGACLEVAGVDDHLGGYGGSTEDLPRALADRDPTLPIVLLAHEPATFSAASEAGVDLQLSGHTHGGQIWPFRYLVRLATPWIAGLYHRGRSQLYVSRGTGFWGPPMRIGAPAEITLLVLRVMGG